MNDKLFCLDGLRALVTGAAGSIGLKTSVALAKQGAKVVMLDYREDALKSASKEVAKITGYTPDVFTQDLSDIQAVKSVFNEVEQKSGNIDVLINNAGIDKDCLFMRMSEEHLDRVMNLNFKVPFLLSQSAVLSMAKRRFGRIINISSVVAFIGNPGQANYCSSKSALLGLTKTIAREYAQRGITANCVAPGAIKSPMTEVLSEDAKNAFISKIPVGYMGEPDEVAYTVTFLASKESSYITGQTLHVNGGMLME